MTMPYVLTDVLLTSTYDASLEVIVAPGHPNKSPDALHIKQFTMVGLSLGPEEVKTKNE